MRSGQPEPMAPLPYWLWLLTGLSGLVASTVTTLTGIGAGLIVYGVLGLAVDLKLLIPLAAPAQLLSNALRFWFLRQHVQWRLGAYLCLGILPGVWLGTSVFAILPDWTLRRALGVFLLGFAGYEWFRGHAVRRPLPFALLPVWGGCAGVLLGTLGVPGPFLAAVFLRYGLLKEDLVVMIALFFLLGNAQRTLLYWHQEALPREYLGLAVVLGVAMLAGVPLGQWLLPRVSHAHFRSLVLAMLLVFGLQFLLW